MTTTQASRLKPGEVLRVSEYAPGHNYEVGELVRVIGSILPATNTVRVNNPTHGLGWMPSSCLEIAGTLPLFDDARFRDHVTGSLF